VPILTGVSFQISLLYLGDRPVGRKLAATGEVDNAHPRPALLVVVSLRQPFLGVMMKLRKSAMVIQG